MARRCFFDKTSIIYKHITNLIKGEKKVQYQE